MFILTFTVLSRHLRAAPAPDSLLEVNALSASLRYRSPIKAVKLLELGRDVFWNQLSHLRTTLDDALLERS